MKDVYIIGGGNSVDDIDKTKLIGKDLIVVNKAILDFPEPKYFITMDHSFLKKLDLQRKVLIKSKATKVFIANLHPHYMEDQGEAIVDTRWNIKYNVKLFDLIIKSREKEGLGYSWNDFRNGYCSAYCALQFAILLGYDKINLIGIDLCAEGKTHYHGGYGESLATFNKRLDCYYKIFKATLLELIEQESDLKIYNCSKISRLRKLLPYKEV